MSCSRPDSERFKQAVVIEFGANEQSSQYEREHFCDQDTMKSDRRSKQKSQRMRGFSRQNHWYTNKLIYTEKQF
jgi:hypothetical protein